MSPLNFHPPLFSAPTLSQTEVILVELKVLKLLYDEISNRLNQQQSQTVINYHDLKEVIVTEAHIANCLINDILDSEEYTLKGIAYYADLPEEILYDLILGRNSDPSASIFIKLVRLHQTVRPDIYQQIQKKICTPDQDQNEKQFKPLCGMGNE